MSSLSEKHWLVIGLGNPGSQYEKTRHNLGFILIDFLARQAGILVKREECRAMVGRAAFENQTIELIKPQTFMNLSGESVSCLLKKDTRSAEKLIVITDDLSLPLGKIRLRPKGSAGGHNGLRSISDCLKTHEYIRLRIGIQTEHPIGETKRFVLENFSKAEFEKVETILEQSAKAIQAVISDGIDKAMAKYN